jgi:ribosomal protein L40E
MNYHTWKASFKNMINNVTITPSEQFSLLIEYTTLTSKQLVQRLRNAYIERQHQGILEIWKKLDERYGCNAVLVKTHLAKLTSFPKINYKDNRKLQEFADLLMELDCAKRDGALAGLRVLDEPIYLKPVISKLPGDIQGRWQRHAFRHMNDHKVDYPSFAEFVSFIELVSREKNDPNLCLNALDGDQPDERNRSRPRRSYKTDIPDAGQGTKSHDPSRWCVVHRRPHPLNQCRAFRAKPIDQRKSLLKQYGICYRCVASSSHMAKDCKTPVKCIECHSDKHISALHAGGPPALGKPNENKDNTNGNMGAPPKPEEAKGHGEEAAKVNTKCTEVCGQQSGAGCSKAD